MRMRPRFLILIIIIFITLGCLGGRVNPTLFPKIATTAPSQPISPPQYWPTGDWRASTPQEQAMDGEKLAQMLTAVERQHLNLHSLLIIRNGYLVSETYFKNYTPERKHELFSCTKSFIATLVGIAIDQGAISGVEQPVLDFFSDEQFDNMDDEKTSMTLENLLTMAAGLDWQEGNLAYMNLYGSSDWDQYMLDLPINAPPGSDFNYCSGCSHVLSAIIHQQVGETTQEYAKSFLFDPLGIEDFSWSVDAEGNAIGGWGLQLTPRDMAKLGFLYLHGGGWDGQQIVSADWVKQASQAHITTGDQGFGFGYGYQWWISSSHGAYAALGRDGQTIYVAPDLNLIVVTTAEINGHSQIFQLIDEFIIPAAN